MRWWTAEALESLGEAALEQNEVKEARNLLGEGLSITREVDNPFDTAGG